MLIEQEPQTSGSPYSEQFVREDLSDKEFRDEFVADQIRLRIATLIRALREQPDRDWSQTELGKKMGGKPQSVVSRLEDPDYGKWSLQTLLELAQAFDLPLWIDFPEWDEWLQLINEVPNSTTRRGSFDAEVLCQSLKPQNVNISYNAATINPACIAPTGVYFSHYTPHTALIPLVVGNMQAINAIFNRAQVCPPADVGARPLSRQSALPWVSAEPMQNEPKHVMPTYDKLIGVTQLGFAS